MIVKRAVKRHSLSYLVKWSLQRGLGSLTRGMRLLPDFIIVGGQRCGTTSLFNYLTQHPDVFPSCPKEVHYFSLHYHKGVNWYRSHFPLVMQKNYVERGHDRKFVAGEATPYYIAHPHAPQRIAETVPEAKLIVLLRNPVDRAYSHYHYEVKNGLETLSFEEALDRKDERLAGEAERLLADENYRSFNHQHYTYLSRGIYVDQLQRWDGFLSKGQLLVIKSEDFYEDPSAILQRVTKFLNLADWKFKDYKKFNPGRYTDMDAGTRKRLLAYFEPHNQRLYRLLDTNFDWDE